MASNDFEADRIKATVAAYIEKRRPPVHLRDELDLTFRMSGQSVEILEIRRLWNRPSEKIEGSRAKARYVKSRREWWVYWPRADRKWHRYEPAATVRTIEEFLAVVDADEFGCFFG